MKKSNNLGVLFFDIILLVYPVELFEAVHKDGILGAFSPFRVVILPLCILYLINYKNSFSKNGAELVTVMLFFLMSFFGTMASSFSSLFSFIGNIIQFLMAYNYISNNRIGRSTLFVISLWAVMQTPLFIISILSGSIGMELRFSGLFFDPNYLCAFVLASVWASFFLLKDSKRQFERYYCFFVIVIGLLMLFLSFSRGGLLAFLFTLLIFLMIHNKKAFVSLLVLSIPLVSSMIVRSHYISWADAAANPIDAFIYRVFTVSDDIDELSAGRTEYMKVFMKNINDYIFFGSDVYDWNDKYNYGGFVHNGFIELMIQGGCIVGLLFIARLIWSIFLCLFNGVRNKQLPRIFIIFLSSITALTFLSYTSKYAWICLGALFALSSKRVFYLHTQL